MTASDERLIVYGTLAPGEPNHHLLKDLKGTWTEGFVRGHLTQVGWGAAQGYPALTPTPDAPRVRAFLLESAELPAHWARLDAFEGQEYQRVLVPFEPETGEIETGETEIGETETGEPDTGEPVSGYLYRGPDRGLRR